MNIEKNSQLIIYIRKTFYKANHTSVSQFGPRHKSAHSVVTNRQK